MKELSRTELATVKRTAANVKTFRARKAKLESKKAKIDEELDIVNKSIELFEAPILEVTGGFTSEQVLNGTMDAARLAESNSNEEVAAQAEAPAEEVAAAPAEEATEANSSFSLFGNKVEEPLPFEN